MLSLCEPNGETDAFITARGLSAVYFRLSGGALYRLSDESGALCGLALLKGQSLYCLASGAADAVSDEIDGFAAASGVCEIISDIPQKDAVLLHVCALCGKLPPENGVEIGTPSGKMFDGCYSLLSAAGFPLPSPDEYYVNSFYRAKSGYPTYCVSEKESVAATAAALGGDSEITLLGAVVTSPDFRGRGYAGALVRRAASDALAAGKLPVITWFAENAGRLYSSLGFEEKAVLSKKRL